MTAHPPLRNTRLTIAFEAVALQLTHEFLALTHELVAVNRKICVVRALEERVRLLGRPTCTAFSNNEEFSERTGSRVSPSVEFLQECGSILMNSSVPLTIGEICTSLLARWRLRAAHPDPLDAVSITLHALAEKGCVTVVEYGGIRKWVWTKAASQADAITNKLACNRSTETEMAVAAAD